MQTLECFIRLLLLPPDGRKPPDLAANWASPGARRHGAFFLPRNRCGRRKPRGVQVGTRQVSSVGDTLAWRLRDAAATADDAGFCVVVLVSCVF
jgi:hypothetical protein